ncbi:MAG: hypothetical protein AB7J13_01930 [Pyrinomonadaceae bacterium]
MPKRRIFPAFDPTTQVIAGFNTDIDHDGTVYHVQTEDKGAPAHMIMTLVYDKGTILASKRSTYEDLLNGNFNEGLLAERLGRQHKLMCAAVKGGRINELVAMTRENAAVARQAKPEKVGAVETLGTFHPISTVERLPPPPVRIPEPAIPAPEIELPYPDEPGPTFEEVSYSDLPLVEAVQIIEDLEILPDEAVAVVSELSGQERTAHTKLSLELIGHSHFKGGERKMVTVMVCRGTDRKVVPEAQIMVKVLGSAFRPVIFHAKSDQNGLASVHLQIPQFHAGRAALLVRAIVDGEEIELRRLVTPG